MRTVASLSLPGVLLAAFLAPMPVWAAGYPTKPVRFIVAFPPGGNADLVARLVGQKLTEGFGRGFVIDNRGGAAGVLAEEVTARSAPDGYTILLVSLAHVVNPALNKNLGYDSMKDLVPVSLVVSVPNALVVHKSLPVQSVPDLIALAKAKPGELNYASSHGTSLHIAGELFKATAGVDIVNVNYKGGGLAVPDLEEFAAVRRSEFTKVTALVAKAGMKAER
jgi:tripartite-type tricarboxylate transporter receptor subunit TctC